ncbi:hypothetical protein NC651_007844 [Populus alba x Populus x berolinensis]|nr:hypothetical protein NC651_007844 [Populus alba x Populus x berolinensis]
MMFAGAMGLDEGGGFRAQRSSGCLVQHWGILPNKVDLSEDFCQTSSMQETHPTISHRPPPQQSSLLIVFVFPPSTASFSAATVITRVHTTTTASLHSSPGSILDCNIDMHLLSLGPRCSLLRTEMILSVLVKNLEATEKKRKVLQYSVNEDDDDEIKEISSKDKGKRVASGSGSTQTTLNQLLKKDIREEACRQIARFFYTSAIPFNCVKNLEFLKALELVAKHGPGFKPPSYYDIREKYLKQEVDQTMNLLEEYKLEWKKPVLNGRFFLSSVDTSNMSKIADKVFEMLDAIVERIEEENVVQVVTDNAANYKAAGHFTKGRDLIRPAATRFATAYLTLGCLNDHKLQLMTMFTSKQWSSCRFARIEEGKRIQNCVLDNRFWHDVTICIKAAFPLIKVLRLVDSDEKPAMGFIYKAMDEAKEKIQAGSTSDRMGWDRPSSPSPLNLQSGGKGRRAYLELLPEDEDEDEGDQCSDRATFLSFPVLGVAAGMKKMMSWRWRWQCWCSCDGEWQWLVSGRIEDDDNSGLAFFLLFWTFSLGFFLCFCFFGFIPLPLVPKVKGQQQWRLVAIGFFLASPEDACFKVRVGVHHGCEEHQPRDVPPLDCSSAVFTANASPAFIASRFIALSEMAPFCHFS